MWNFGFCRFDLVVQQNEVDYLHDQLVAARSDSAAQLLLLKEIAQELDKAGIDRASVMSSLVDQRWQARLDQTAVVGVESPGKHYPFATSGFVIQNTRHVS